MPDNSQQFYATDKDIFDLLACAKRSLTEGASEKLLVIVRSMALSGENLIASKEYLSLKERGFYITSITWKSRQTTIPYDVPHLHAEFEDGENGRNFKYSVKGSWISFSDQGSLLISEALPYAARVQLGVSSEWNIPNLKPEHASYLTFHRANEFRRTP